MIRNAKSRVRIDAALDHLAGQIELPEKPKKGRDPDYYQTVFDEWLAEVLEMLAGVEYVEEEPESNEDESLIVDEPLDEEAAVNEDEVVEDEEPQAPSGAYDSMTFEEVQDIAKELDVPRAGTYKSKESLVAAIQKHADPD